MTKCENENCNRPAIASGEGGIFRFHPISDEKKVVLCKTCSEKVQNYTRALIKKR